MASRTQLVCLCEGSSGQSIDNVFINRVIKSLKPNWLRGDRGSNIVRIIPCGNRQAVIERMPKELETCIRYGGDTTLLVCADCDDDHKNPESLKAAFWSEAKKQGTSGADFGRVVFVFPKDRLENWVEFLLTGSTDEAKEGPRVKHSRDAAVAGKKLAELCLASKPLQGAPPSLVWSCANWRALIDRMAT